MCQYHTSTIKTNVCVCLSVCACVKEVGNSGGGIIVVTHDLCTYYTLYWVCVITSGRTRGVAAEQDAVRWRGHNWGAASWSGRSSAWPCETSAHQRHQLLHQSRGLHQTCADVVIMRWDNRSTTMSAAENCRAPCCANTNGSESSFDFCILQRVADASAIADCIQHRLCLKGCLKLVDSTGIA